VDLYLKEINNKVKSMKQELLTVENLPPFTDESFPTAPSEKNLKKVLDQVISLCQRNSARMSESENESVWFKVLDSLVGPLNEMKGVGLAYAPSLKDDRRLIRRTKTVAEQMNANLDKNERLKRAITLFLKSILESMMGYVALASLVQKVVRDYAQDKFGDFRNIFMSMLDVTSYELNILLTANKLLEEDAYKQFALLVKARRKAVTPENIKIITRRDEVATDKKQAPATTTAPSSTTSTTTTPPPPSDKKETTTTTTKDILKQRLETFRWPTESSKLFLLAQIESGQNLAPALPNSKPSHVILSKINEGNSLQVGLPQGGKLSSVGSRVSAMTIDDSSKLFGKQN